MALWRIAVRVEGVEAAEAVAEILDELTGGVSAFETREAGTGPAEWSVEAYASAPLADAALDLRLTLAATAAEGKILDLIELPVAERDWLAENRRAFPPQRIGRFFVHGSHWRGPPPAAMISIEIDAATAFGTGEHASTRGCLVALERLAKARRFRRPRDIGTGSGILAIAAAKVLRRRVLASDNDEQAVAVARRHARRNGVGRLVRVECRAGAGRTGCHDLVFANILARPLMAMSRDVARALAPRGRVVLAGLLQRQEAAVLSAYRRQRLALDFRIVIDGWSALVLRRACHGTPNENGPPPEGTGRQSAFLSALERREQREPLVAAGKTRLVGVEAREVAVARGAVGALEAVDNRRNIRTADADIGQGAVVERRQFRVSQLAAPPIGQRIFRSG